MRDPWREMGSLKRCALTAPLLIFMSVALASAASAPSVPSFLEPVLYDAVGGSLAVGDIDGDRKLDVVTGNYGCCEGSEGFSVFHNIGHGRLAKRRDYRIGKNVGVYGVALGDLNRDGALDVATVNHESRSVSVFLNGGGGAFAEHSEYRVGSDPRDIAVADLNADDELDLVTANGAGNTVSVLLGRGDGTFAPNVRYATAHVAYSLAAADLNGDGRADLAVIARESDFVSVLLNRGDGTFARHVDYRIRAHPAEIAIGDLNGDGKPDLVTSQDASENVSILFNDGHGIFGRKVDYSDACCQAIAVGDVNGDRRPDLVVADDGHRCFTAAALLIDCFAVFANQGGGRFERAFFYLDGLRVGGGSLALADLNGDRRLDLVAAGHDGRASRVTVLLAGTARHCIVPTVRGLTASAAKKAIVRAGCRVAVVRSLWGRDRKIPSGYAAGTEPGPRTVLPANAGVALELSKGRRG
jgi:FG-GAP-like repeat